MTQDRVTRLLEELDDPRLPAALAELSPGELVAFDWRVRRRWDVPWGRVAVLRLMSGNGYLRQEAVETVPLTPLTVRLIVLRCTDWVDQVRDAALDRLDACPNDLLVDALPLAERFATQRSRGTLLEALLDARLGDEDLRFAATSRDRRTRRAAWSRLARRGVLATDEIAVVARDEDVVVRRIAVDALETMHPEERRALARVLLDDRVGWIAARALAVLVALDGAEPIVGALTARTSTVRRAARDWARVRDVDARAVYLARLESAGAAPAAPRDTEPGAAALDTVALIGLAEVGDARDVERFRAMLRGSRPLRAAGLRALARHDRPAARAAALAALRDGPANRAAADVLRERPPIDAEVAVLTEIARDLARPEGERRRVLSLLGPGTWLHFTVALETELADDVPVPQGRPNARLRPRLEPLVERLPTPRRETLAFVLR